MFLLKDIFVNVGLMKKENILLKKCIWASLVIQRLSLLCNARDTGLIPGPGRSHMPRSS